MRGVSPRWGWNWASSVAALARLLVRPHRCRVAEGGDGQEDPLSRRRISHGSKLQTRRVRKQIKVSGGAVSLCKLHVVYCNAFPFPPSARASGLSTVQKVRVLWRAGGGGRVALSCYRPHMARDSVRHIDRRPTTQSLHLPGGWAAPGKGDWVSEIPEIANHTHEKTYPSETPR